MTKENDKTPGLQSHHAPPSKIFHKDNHVAIPLRMVLKILGLRIEYRADAYVFYRASTGREVFRIARGGRVNDPWDALKFQGLLRPSKFESRAKRFMKSKNNEGEDEDGTR